MGVNRSNSVQKATHLKKKSKVEINVTVETGRDQRS